MEDADHHEAEHDRHHDGHDPDRRGAADRGGGDRRLDRLGLRRRARTGRTVERVGARATDRCRRVPRVGDRDRLHRQLRGPAANEVAGPHDGGGVTARPIADPGAVARVEIDHRDRPVRLDVEDARGRPTPSRRRGRSWARHRPRATAGRRDAVPRRAATAVRRRARRRSGRPRRAPGRRGGRGPGARDPRSWAAASPRTRCRRGRAAGGPGRPGRRPRGAVASPPGSSASSRSATVASGWWTTISRSRREPSRSSWTCTGALRGPRGAGGLWPSRVWFAGATRWSAA